MSEVITRVELSCFRGATGVFGVEFLPNKSISMLFGENGTGKSSILDAIDVVCCGTNGCLDEMSMGRNPGQYLCSLGKDVNDCSVTIYSDHNQWSGNLTGSGFSVAEFANKPIVKMLRRNAILKLVLAQPSERYKELKKFIDIGRVENSEIALLQSRNILSEKISGLDLEITRMQQQLDAAWVKEDKEKSYQCSGDWVKEKLRLGIDGLKSQKKKNDTFIKMMQDAVRLHEEYKNYKSQKERIDIEIDEIDAKIDGLSCLNVENAIGLLESLQKAKEYIESCEKLDVCPTCQRSMEKDILLEIVGKQFEGLSELKRLSDNKKAFVAKKQTVDSNCSEWRKKIEECLVGIEECQKRDPLNELGNSEVVWPVWGQDKDYSHELGVICDQLNSVVEVLGNLAETVVTAITEFSHIEQWHAGIEKFKSKVDSNKPVLNSLQRAYDIVHEKRIAFTQIILDEIKEEADRLYQAIHPGEKIGLDSLKIEENRRGSVSQTCIFNGYAEILPQAIYSESHLDTLGFCVWLALAKKDDSQNTIVVIDDVFSSVDASHLSRIVELLNAESANFLQMIVATHYRLWWEKTSGSPMVQRIHLGRWTVEKGIVAQNMPLVTEHLKMLLDEPVLDRQSVASKAGIILEDLLDDLAMLYECKMPRSKNNLYTLGTLMDGCGQLVNKKGLKVEIDRSWNLDGEDEDWGSVDISQYYQAIKGLMFIRNQIGCHFNVSGFEIPDDEIILFAQNTIKLVEAIVCPSCGMIPNKKSSDSRYMRCSCVHKPVRMTPVISR